MGQRAPPTPCMPPSSAWCATTRKTILKLPKLQRDMLEDMTALSVAATHAKACITATLSFRLRSALTTNSTGKKSRCDSEHPQRLAYHPPPGVLAYTTKALYTTLHLVGQRTPPTPCIPPTLYLMVCFHPENRYRSFRKLNGTCSMIWQRSPSLQQTQKRVSPPRREPKITLPWRASMAATAQRWRNFQALPRHIRRYGSIPRSTSIHSPACLTTAAWQKL